MHRRARRDPRPATESPWSAFWRQRWENIKPAACALIEDGLQFLIFLAVLTAVYLGLAGLAVLGYDPRRIDRFETIHYYAYLVVFGAFMLDLVIRILLHTASRVFKKE